MQNVVLGVCFSFQSARFAFVAHTDFGRRPRSAALEQLVRSTTSMPVHCCAIAPTVNWAIVACRTAHSPSFRSLYVWKSAPAARGYLGRNVDSAACYFVCSALIRVRVKKRDKLKDVAAWL